MIGSWNSWLFLSLGISETLVGVLFCFRERVSWVCFKSRGQCWKWNFLQDLGRFSKCFFWKTTSKSWSIPLKCMIFHVSLTPWLLFYLRRLPLTLTTFTVVWKQPELWYRIQLTVLKPHGKLVLSCCWWKESSKWFELCHFVIDRTFRYQVASNRWPNIFFDTISLWLLVCDHNYDH